MYDLVLKGGEIVTHDHQARADVAIRHGRIAALGLELGPAREIRDVTGKLVLPGGVDPHCHIEQLSGMGLMNADTFETATASALHGGTTTVISFAAQAKGERLSDTVAAYQARATRGARADHAFHIIISDTEVAHFEADLHALADAGHKSLKIFTTYNIGLDDQQIARVLRLAKTAGALVCVHAENDALIKATTAQLLAQGLTRPEHHALSHPRAAEIEAVSRTCAFAAYFDQPVMLFHISTAEAVDVVRKARAAGAPIWAETCPHYLMMTADILRQDGMEGAKFMCSPPQREAADQRALWEGLADGTLDLISSDHAPYRFDATGKLSAGPAPRFDQIANGLPGLETRLPLLFDAVVRNPALSLSDFVRWTAFTSAQLYGLPNKGRIEVGFDADLVVWDPNHQVTYTEDDLHDAVGYNPWAGRRVTGWPETVLLRGEVVLDKGTLTAPPGAGRWLPRTRGTPPSGTPAPEWAIASGATS